MEKLVHLGKTKFIGRWQTEGVFHPQHLSNDQKFAGLSNFSSPKIKRLLESATIKPICNQIECHPYFPQKSLVKLCQDENIHITAFGPLGCVPIPALVGRSGPGPLLDETVRTPSD